MKLRFNYTAGIILREGKVNKYRNNIRYLLQFSDVKMVANPNTNGCCIKDEQEKYYFREFLFKLLLQCLFHLIFLDIHSSTFNLLYVILLSIFFVKLFPFSEKVKFVLYFSKLIIINPLQMNVICIFHLNISLP